MEYALRYGYLVRLNELSDNEGELIFLLNCETPAQVKARLFSMGIDTCAYDLIRHMSEEEFEALSFDID